MAWVKRADGGGQRHFFDAPVNQTVEGSGGHGLIRIRESIDEPALCGETMRIVSGYLWDNGRRKSGGLSVKVKVDMMQNNVCSYCRKKYLERVGIDSLRADI